MARDVGLAIVELAKENDKSEFQACKENAVSVKVVFRCRYEFLFSVFTYRSGIYVNYSSVDVYVENMFDNDEVEDPEVVHGGIPPVVKSLMNFKIDRSNAADYQAFLDVAWNEIDKRFTAMLSEDIDWSRPGFYDVTDSTHENYHMNSVTARRNNKLLVASNEVVEKSMEEEFKHIMNLLRFRA